MAYSVTKVLPISEININQKTKDEYSKFVKQNPKFLPETEVFDKISKIYSKMPKLTKNEQSALYYLFSVPDNIKRKLADSTTPSINTTLHNNTNVDLYMFLTQMLYFTKNSIFETGIFDNSIIKLQLGIDLHRLGPIKINDITVPSEQLNEFAFNNRYLAETDYFNTFLIDVVSKSNFPISLNTINLIDICLIQQVIQFTSDMVLLPITKRNIHLKGGRKYLTIILNKDKSYVEYNMESTLFTFDNQHEIVHFGQFNCIIRMNTNDLTYSLNINLVNDKQTYTNKLAQIGKDAVEYTKNNPSKVTSGLTIASSIGSVMGLVAAGLLGGKTKRRKKNKNKRKTKLSIKRKNKTRRKRQIVN